MSTVGATGSSSSSQTSTTSNAFEKLDLNDFIKMLVAELQNQDPMNPMSNSEMLQQVSQIKAIESNDRLSTTMDSVMLGQNVGTASSLIGQTVTALTDDGDKTTGKVKSATIADGVVKLNIGDQSVKLNNLIEIQPTT